MRRQKRGTMNAQSSSLILVNFDNEEDVASPTQDEREREQD
jgi:hypothetical protein